MTSWFVGLVDGSDDVFNFLPILKRIHADETACYLKLANKRIIVIHLYVKTENHKAQYFTNIQRGYYLFDSDGFPMVDIDLQMRLAVESLGDEYDSKIHIIKPEVKLTNDQRKKLIAYFDKRSHGVWERTSAKVKTLL